MKIPVLVLRCLLLLSGLCGGPGLHAARKITLVVDNNQISGMGSVRVLLNSEGDESRVACSVSFNPEVLRFDTGVRGAQVGAAGTFSVNTTLRGSVGLDVARPAGTVFSAGSCELAVLHFTVVAARTTSAPLALEIEPFVTSIWGVGGSSVTGENVATGATITAAPLPSAPVFTSASNATFFVGDRVAFLITATGSPAPTFSVVGGNFPPWAAFDEMGIFAGMPVDVAGSPFSFVIQASNGVGLPVTQNFTLTIKVRPAPPTITAPPVAATVQQGRPATFSVAATGAGPLSYEWRKNGVPIAGATATTLTVASAQPSDAGNYQALVTNEGGSTFSNEVTLTVLPSTMFPIVATALGWRHALYLGKDGSLLACGDNSFGQLGDGTRTGRTTPFVVAAGGVVAVAAAGYSSYFLKTDGTVWAMGNNMSGQLGDGSTTIPTMAVQVALNRVVAIEAGGAHFLMIRSDGSLWSVGQNSDGQLGDGSTTDQRGPVQIATGVRAVSAGAFSTHFLKTDGTLWACGSNISGELGDGTGTSRRVPVRVATGVARVAAGDFHTVFLKTDGSFWGMGQGMSGALANGTTASPNAPLQAFASGAAFADAGTDYTLYIKGDGTLWGAGRNDSGQLGNGATAVQVLTPVPIASGTFSAAAATNHSRFFKSDGTFWAMGDNTYGQFGDGTTTGRLSAVELFPHAAFAAPVVPVGVAATDGAGPGLVQVTWTPVVGATHYEVWRREGAAGVYVKLDGNVGAALYQDTAVVAGTAYVYAVKAAAFGVLSEMSAGAVGYSALAPSIDTQPLAQTAAVGSAVTLRVGATGSPAPGYQWRKNAAAISGATAAVYTIPAVTAADAGRYDVVVTNSMGAITSLPVNVTVVAPPVIASSASAEFVVGLPGRFALLATGLPPPTWSISAGTLPSWVTWDANAGVLSGTPPDSVGSPFGFTVTASNGVAPAANQSFTLKVLAPAAPVLSTPPVGQVVGAGATLTLSVGASGAPAPSYQWRRNGVDLAGATAATYMRLNATLADAGSYTVVVSNTVGNVTSPPVTVTVIPAGTVARQAVVRWGYTAGGTLTLSHTLNFTGAVTSAGWQLLLPAGWSYASSTGDSGATKPIAGAGELAEWSWTNPTNPIAFTCTLNVPANATGTYALVSGVTLVLEGTTIPLVAQPDPLVVAAATARHTADTNGDGKLSLLELTRVIELYNTRNGAVRTGRYQIQSGSEDGFAADGVTAATAQVNLSRYHAADPNRDGKITLLELTRVIELYNTRTGPTRTGSYHAEAGTEDGFAPGL